LHFLSADNHIHIHKRRTMRILILLLLLAYVVPSALALRGEKRSLLPSNHGRSIAEAPKEGDPKEGHPKNVDPKEAVPSKTKEAKKCKKAGKHAEKKKTRRARKVRGRRQLQVKDDDAPYCLHGAVSEEQCTDLKGVPKEASLSSDLSFELVHSSEENAETILGDVQEILNDDAVPRYVGCREMAGPPKHKSKERFLAEDTEDLYIDEEDWVEVTGVSFNNLDLVRDGKKGVLLDL
jgi:hypothetical protein